MEHTVREYLEKQSTEYLTVILKEIFSGVYGDQYNYLIPELIDVLYKRKQNAADNSEK